MNIDYVIRVAMLHNNALNERVTAISVKSISS